MDMSKLAKVREILSELPGAVVAFSGGVDSTFLAVMAREVLGEKMLAVTASSPTYPEHQLAEARELAARYSLPHLVIETDEFDCAEFVANPADRCYYCKSSLFRELRRIAGQRGLGAVLDGANLDDRNDHRPGHRAARELGIRSPLQEAGLTKEDIRRFSREMGLPTADKPAYACLASRVPYGTRLTPEILARVDRAERGLTALGFRELRVRDHHPVARLEVSREEMEGAWRSRAEIVRILKEAGYVYAALDLEGFRSGSMNAVLPHEELES